MNESGLAVWAERYDKKEDATVEQIGATVRERGYLTLLELRRLAQWKSPRIGPRINKNDDSAVMQVTRLAFQTDDPILAINALRLLSGVDWAMASVILHLCSTRPYPIIDVRALWTIGFDKRPAYTPSFWDQYTRFCRALAQRTDLSIRDVDRGLWQYSKESGKMAS